MEKIKQYSRIIIKPGSYPSFFDAENLVLDHEAEGTIVEIYGDQELFTVDIGLLPEEMHTIDVKRPDIIKVI